MSISFSKAEDDPFSGTIDVKKEDIQLFEIPKITDDCERYAKLGYATKEQYTKTNTSLDLSKSGWIKLSDNTDFTCHEGFEKIFVHGFNLHFTRLWCDGTILSKNGSTAEGATPVWRTLVPNHPYIMNLYPPISEIWIRECKDPIISTPFFRWQSVAEGSDVSSLFNFEEEDETIPTKYYAMSKTMQVTILIPNYILQTFVGAMQGSQLTPKISAMGKTVCLFLKLDEGVALANVCKESAKAAHLASTR